MIRFDSKKDLEHYDNLYHQIYEKDKEIERLNNVIQEIQEKIDDYFGYDYENESQARLDTLNEINHIVVELKKLKGGE